MAIRRPVSESVRQQEEQDVLIRNAEENIRLQHRLKNLATLAILPNISGATAGSQLSRKSKISEVTAFPLGNRSLSLLWR